MGKDKLLIGPDGSVHPWCFKSDQQPQILKQIPCKDRETDKRINEIRALHPEKLKYVTAALILPVVGGARGKDGLLMEFDQGQIPWLVLFKE